jgi:hypothetical protein
MIVFLFELVRGCNRSALMITRRPASATADITHVRYGKLDLLIACEVVLFIIALLVNLRSGIDKRDVDA